MQRFAVTDYDAANSDKVCDTLYKSALQRCQLRGRPFDATVSDMLNDDIPATEIQGPLDPEIEELVDLAMEAYAAEVGSQMSRYR